jgi:hypothetical protein
MNTSHVFSEKRTWFTVIAEKLNIDTHHQAKLNDVDIHVYSKGKSKVK